MKLSKLFLNQNSFLLLSPEGILQFDKLHVLWNKTLRRVYSAMPSWTMQSLILRIRNFFFIRGTRSGIQRFELPLDGSTEKRKLWLLAAIKWCSEFPHLRSCGFLFFTFLRTCHGQTTVASHKISYIKGLKQSGVRVHCINHF